MNMKYLGAATAAALLLSGAQAFAATIVIDNFDDAVPQSVSDEPSLGLMSMSSRPADVIGGVRTLTVENTDDGLPDGDVDNATSLEVAGGLLSFSNKAGATGRGSLLFDAGGAGLNLSASSGATFNFDVERFDNDANVEFSVTAMDSAGTSIFFMENLMRGFSPILSFEEFRRFSDDFDSFNFGNISSLMFTVDTTGLTRSIDGQLDGITLNTEDLAPIPLPAAGFLLLGGLGGLAALRRRRKA